MKRKTKQYRLQFLFQKSLLVVCVLESQCLLPGAPNHCMLFCSLVGTLTLRLVVFSHKVIYLFICCRLVSPWFSSPLLTLQFIFSSPCVTMFLCTAPLRQEFYTLLLSGFGRWELFWIRWDYFKITSMNFTLNISLLFKAWLFRECWHFQKSRRDECVSSYSFFFPVCI